MWRRNWPNPAAPDSGSSQFNYVPFGFSLHRTALSGHSGSGFSMKPPTGVRVLGNRLAQHVPEQTKEVASDYPLGLHRPASLDREAF